MIDNKKMAALAPRHWIFFILLVGFFSFIAGTRYPIRDAVTGADGQGDGGISVDVRGIGGQPPSGVARSVDFDQFWEVWRLLDERFYKQPLSEEDMLYGAMRGLAEATGDPYTVFFKPTIAEEFKQSLDGKFEGIGAEIGIKDGQLQIVAPLPDTPAATAGLLPKDAILAIDGEDTLGLIVEEAVLRIRGEKGSTVVLTVGRMKNGAPTTFDVSIIRDTIVVPSVRLDYPQKGIARITVTHFNSDTVNEFSTAVETARAEDIVGVVLDLRNNPGGFLDRAIAIAGEWVGDRIVVIEERQGEPVDEFHGTGNSRLEGIPTVVLVNEGSASASEIVAGALQDYGMATVVGTTTFGKGSVQDFTELENGAAVKITVAEWKTPLGRSINDVGITPDIIVEQTEQDTNDDRDPQLEKAIEIIRDEK